MSASPKRRAKGRSTYTLTYDPKRDELQGVYFQAVQKQNFEVVFVRTK